MEAKDRLKNSAKPEWVFFLLFSSSVLQGSLIISQYIETNSGTTPKGVELWNVSGSTIDFSSNNLVIKKGTNGGTPSTDYTLSSGTLFSGGVIVVGTSGDLATETTNNGGTHYTESFTFNGDDALEIYLGGTLTDMFGVSGSDPGTEWVGSSVSTKNQNIQLKSGIWSGDTDGWTDPSTRFETVSTTPVSDQTGFGIAPGVLISGNSGFRMMSSPVEGQIYSDLLSELWTQGMTSADATSGDANVWTYDGSSWSALSDITGSGDGASLTAGQGFLVYVYADTDFDGTDDLPVSLSVSGIEYSSSATVPSSGSIADGSWELAGNPYAQTIDWDDVTQTSVTSTAYVWDDAASGGAAYISWNGSTGSLTDGLIAPFQGFWVKGSGGSGSLTIATADKSNSSGAFYRTAQTYSATFTVTSATKTHTFYLSFNEDGIVGMDNYDAHKLMPLEVTQRLVGMTFADGNSLDINNLPLEFSGTTEIDMDVMSLNVSEGVFETTVEDVTMTWDLSALPAGLSLMLTNNETDETLDLSEAYEFSFTTQEKGSVTPAASGVSSYPMVGTPLLQLTISALSQDVDENPMPSVFTLHPAYPNPFNPSTTISFDAPNTAVETLHATSLLVYNIKGQLVKTLVNNVLSAGNHTVKWDGTDANGNPSGAGIYLIQLKSGTKTQIQKITLLK